MKNTILGFLNKEFFALIRMDLGVTDRCIFHSHGGSGVGCLLAMTQMIRKRLPRLAETATNSPANAAYVSLGMHFLKTVIE